ncbi:unnamed protein product, partial [Prorocentrum cordatum]
IGSTLNEHFSGFAHSSWRAWKLDKDAELAFKSPSPPQHFYTERKYLLGIGVAAEKISQIPFASEEPGVLEDVAPLEDSDVAPLVSGDSAASSRAARGGGSGAAHAALDHLHGIARARSGGFVPHVFDPFYLMAALQLKHHSKQGRSLKSVLHHAAPFFFDQGQSSQFQHGLRECALPTESTMREARVQLDLLSSGYARLRQKDYVNWIYLNPDSSPQLGWNWLVVREDKFSWPKDDSIDAIMASNFNSKMQSRTCRLSTIGRGHGAAIFKSVSLATLHKCECSSIEDYNKLRSEVYGICTDQGVESAVVDIDTLEPKGDRCENYSDNRARMYPNALGMPESLHIMFNALQHAVEKLPCHKTFISDLRNIENFLADRSLRRLFVNTCLDDSLKSKFDHYSTVHISWRWEVLAKALTELIPRFSILKDRFDLGKMKTSPERQVKTHVIDDAYASLQVPHFLKFCIMVKTSGNTLERFASRLEGCECHASLWKSHSNHKKKTRLGQCLEALKKCDSDELQLAMGKLDCEPRAQLLRLQTQLADSLVEELSDKFAFKDVIPYAALKIYMCEIPGGNLHSARMDAADCARQYDSAVEAGRGHLLHRVAHLLLRPGTHCRSELDDFANGVGHSLRDFTHLHSMIMRYALIPIVGRRVEGAHAIIRRLGLIAKNMSPPCISASNSEAEHLARLDNDAEFKRYCQSTWSSKSLLNDLLSLVVPGDALKEMSRKDKINRVYQCDLASEFKDLSVERQSHDTWKLLTQHLRSAHPGFPYSWKIVVTYLKEKLCSGSIFSLPTSLYNLALVDHGPDEIDISAVNPWEQAIDVIGHEPSEFQFDAVDSVTFFEVVNPWPEKRKQIALSHIIEWGDRVNVRRRLTLQTDVCDRSVTLLCDADYAETLHMRPLVHDLKRSLLSLYTWAVMGDWSALGVRQRNLGEPEHIVAAPRSLVIPSASDALVVSSPAEVVALPDVGELALERYEATTSEKMVACLGKLRDLQHGDDRDDDPVWVQYTALEGVHMNTIQDLHKAGAITAVNDEFGELVVCLQKAGTMFRAVRKVGRPLQLCFVDSTKFASKLDMIFALLRGGWKPGATRPFKIRGARKFMCNKDRPLSYFACLLQVDMLFEKGLKQLPHDLKDYHYQCFLRLAGHALLAFEADLQSHGLEECRRLLRDAPEAPVDAPPLEDDLEPAASVEAATLGKFGQAMERHSGGVLGGNSLVDQALSQKSLLAGVAAPPTPSTTPGGGVAQRPSRGQSSRPSKVGSRDMFWCCKCHQERPMSLCVSRGTQQICDPDVKAYNSLVARWKGKPCLRKWWHGKSEADQAEWYRKQQAHVPGTKRKFDEMEVSETSARMAVKDDVKEDDWIPLNIYQRRVAMEGVSNPDAAQEFKRIVERGEGLWRAGQWHVHDYQGFKMHTGIREAQGYATTGKYAVAGREDLARRVEECSTKLDSQLLAHEQSLNGFQAAPSRDAPNIQCPTNGGVTLPQ